VVRLEQPQSTSTHRDVELDNTITCGLHGLTLPTRGCLRHQLVEITSEDHRSNHIQPHLSSPVHAPRRRHGPVSDRPSRSTTVALTSPTDPEVRRRTKPPASGEVQRRRCHPLGGQFTLEGNGGRGDDDVEGKGHLPLVICHECYRHPPSLHDIVQIISTSRDSLHRRLPRRRGLQSLPLASPSTTERPASWRRISTSITVGDVRDSPSTCRETTKMHDIL